MRCDKRSFQIGDVDDGLTEFNVGEGNTDETDSLNVIHIGNTSGTLDGISNDPTIAAGTKYYTFSILAPGCASQGDPVVRVDTSFDQDGHLTGTDSVEVRLAVQPWENTVYDLHQNQSQFALCLQTDIMAINSALSPTLIERKHFAFVVTILLPTFGFEDPTLDDNGQTSFLQLPCRGARKRTQRRSKFKSSMFVVE